MSNLIKTSWTDSSMSVFYGKNLHQIYDLEK